MIKFRVEGKPFAKGRPRFTTRGNFAMVYTDSKTRAAEENFAAQAIKFKPETPLENAIKLNVIFASIKPKSKPKKVIHWTTRPDLDNFIKLVKDALNKIFWRDDSQIVEITAKKIYDSSFYTELEIEEIKDIAEDQKVLTKE